MAKKKKKSGSIAVPYLLTIFIGILVIGGGAYLLLRYWGILGVSHELPKPPERNVSVSTYADNHTILFILDEPDKKCSSTFMLLRSIPKDKKLVFIGLPTNTIAMVDDKQQKLSEVYSTGGAAAAVTFTEAVFGIDVERYMKLNSDAFLKICDILGGANYTVPEEVAGFNSDGVTPMYLNAEQIEKLITYNLYEDGEFYRAYTTSSVFSKMINSKNAPRISDNLDSSFNTIVNMADTDITAVDYKKLKTSIKSMLENPNFTTNIGIYDGDNAYEDFIPNEDSIADLKKLYYSYDEEKDNDKQND